MSEQQLDSIQPPPAEPAAKQSGSPLEGVKDILSAAMGDQAEQIENESRETETVIPADGEAQPSESDVRDLEIADEFAEAEPASADASELPAPADFQQLAERAGITLEELYKLAVPMGDGSEPVPLGELKDRAKEIGTVEEAKAQLDENRSSFENEMIRAKQELQEVVALLPPNAISPELLQQARERTIAHIDEQRAHMLDIKPEWRDPVAYRAAQDEMLAVIGDYGFTRNDLDHVHDYRLTKLVYDFAKMKQRIEKANARAKEIRKAGKRKPSRSTAAARQPGNQTVTKPATKSDQLAAVNDLINSR